jgi:hypothetical protein
MQVSIATLVRHMLDQTAGQAVGMAQVQSSVTERRRQEVTGEYCKAIAAVLQAMVREAQLAQLAQLSQGRCVSYRTARDSPQSSPQLAGDSPRLQLDSPQLDPLAALAESDGRVEGA